MTCFYCGKEHEFKCPMISAYEFYPDGVGIRRIEFVTFVDLEGWPLVTSLELPPGTTRQ